ncbi:hypothetical protein AB0L88_01660 [Saccharopolyspora shandongensis]|uniref:ArsR/SmtB family transcription factor n=1 Tax=Saccharopolyspora shandongensis TaxID=418495 RepID=UPI003442F968
MGAPRRTSYCSLPCQAERGADDLRLEVVFGALSDPLRMEIVRRLLLESEALDHSCGWFGFDRPKSSLTHHFKALREAGLTRQRQYGTEKFSRCGVSWSKRRTLAAPLSTEAFAGLVNSIKAGRFDA